MLAVTRAGGSGLPPGREPCREDDLSLADCQRGLPGECRLILTKDSGLLLLVHKQLARTAGPVDLRALPRHPTFPAEK